MAELEASRAATSKMIVGITNFLVLVWAIGAASNLLNAGQPVGSLGWVIVAKLWADRSSRRPCHG